MHWRAMSVSRWPVPEVCEMAGGRQEVSFANSCPVCRRFVRRQGWVRAIGVGGVEHYGLGWVGERAGVGSSGLGNGWVRPAGTLREPPSRLDGVDAIV